MPRDAREPQSYGSGKDWVTGETGQKVHDPKSSPPPRHRDFYENRRESETSPAPQGGLPSETQFNDSPTDVCDPRVPEEAPVTRVTMRDGGAKRDSFFKRRDYE
jgi:hypothetical protein